jgi:hypothetical protein
MERKIEFVLDSETDMVSVVVDHVEVSKFSQNLDSAEFRAGIVRILASS